MPNYRYKAMGATGERMKGVLLADNKESVKESLRNQSAYLLEAVEIKETVKFDFSKKVKARDIYIFCRQFYVMLDAGMPIVSCIDILRNQAENKRLVFSLTKIYEALQKGSYLSEAMERHGEIFPSLLVQMIRAGESSGTLDHIMDRMATYFEKEDKVNNKIKVAMRYPLFLGGVSSIVIIFILTFVMPTFIDLYSGAGVELPMLTRFLIATSELIKTKWYVLLAVIAGAVLLVRKLLKKDEKASYLVEVLKLKIPVLGVLTKNVVTSRFARTFSILFNAGIPVVKCLEIVSDIVQNGILKKGIAYVIEETKKGVPLSASIKKIEFFDPIIISMIEVGEESGALDYVLDKAANFYDEEVETGTEKFISLLEPTMILIMAVIIGSIVIGVMLPLFDMIGKI